MASPGVKVADQTLELGNGESCWVQLNVGVDSTVESLVQNDFDFRVL